MMFDDKGISQKERRAVLENDRRVREGSTYSEVTKVYADDMERGGRYSATQVDQVRPTSGGWASLWTNDGGPEAPLGYSVNDQEPTGEKFEVEASRKASPTLGEPPPSSATGVGVGERPATDTSGPLIRKRLRRI